VRQCKSSQDPIEQVALIRAPKARTKTTVGIRILSRSIEELLRQIVENAGEDAAVERRSRRARALMATTPATGEYGDMLEEGILDPAMVMRLRLAIHGHYTSPDRKCMINR
jgi:chaperonin GroEL